MKPITGLKIAHASGRIIDRKELATLMRRMRKSCSFNREIHGRDKIYYFADYTATIYGDFNATFAEFMASIR